MFQTVAMIYPANVLLILVFGNFIFEFVSYFDIRISNFAKPGSRPGFHSVWWRRGAMTLCRFEAVPALRLFSSMV